MKLGFHEMRKIFLTSWKTSEELCLMQITVKANKAVEVELHAPLTSVLEWRHSLTSRPLYPLRKSSFYRLNMRLDGPQKKSGDLAAENCRLPVRNRTMVPRSCGYPTSALLQKYTFLHNHKIKHIRSRALLLLFLSNTSKV